jgi:hypothetical protein
MVYSRERRRSRREVGIERRGRMWLINESRDKKSKEGGE